MPKRRQTGYWYNSGKHQKVYKQLRSKLVPDYGEADTEAGEMIRVFGNVMYDIANNGGCNLGDSKRGDVEKFLDFLSEYGYEHAQTERLAAMLRWFPRHDGPAIEDDVFTKAFELMDAAGDFLILKAVELTK